MKKNKLTKNQKELKEIAEATGIFLGVLAIPKLIQKLNS